MGNVSFIDGHIDEPRMSDNEIIKALELCGSEYECHNGCPYYNNGQFKCRDLSIYRDSLDLINRQKAENSNLTSDLTSLQKDLTSAKAEIERLKKGWKADILLTTKAKAEAVKEVANILESRLEGKAAVFRYGYAVAIAEIKEMVGEE